ncbi:phosphate ABC transporter, permease protein PstA [Candidatus Methylacidiphilum fumarolicum]|uniref:Phosphate transport system permease protein PstA n=2 Tax=Candidatus Methylacidiphilum fumarolicum TaxID=591154 RepID=I0JXT5_METFB|nr:phosphate ABC transporter permease PstA [Candidatus Methylacidiphilum fumarolicum]MBW6414236.1 phosphate ABC transporter permease PstA [Candidatus Methylacidiphilum fumarolicum]TFE69932.1 phosphate ABC transporter, permease protein PstA [Candidatus Methylacidiphilum fumarolicum]TFE73738.1 phosphate ABC transporter, permease protein PstA [Candidatus Methylacidiphilum fumarolicum]TFE75656.1 phosphate ABC transporter, permease protein PstA [Candidatus Methylacidiphilum fumarolicum]TFE76821.1 p
MRIAFYRFRKLENFLVKLLCAFASFFVILPFVLILVYLIVAGASSINFDFITQLPKPIGEKGGGMANSIVGTLILMGLTFLIGTPIGILSGVFVSEYGNEKLRKIVRFSADLLNGTPSIVIGILVYGWIVSPMHGFSVMAASIALSLIFIPLVLRTTEESLLLVPKELRDAALALGIRKWKVVCYVLIETAKQGILSGILVALARIAGETAPLLFTAFGNQYWTYRLDEPISALPLQIFEYAISPYEQWHRDAWAGALVLLLLIFLLHLSVRILLKKNR